jgi:pyridoxal phosphate enzyme (YggS family)
MPSRSLEDLEPGLRTWEELETMTSTGPNLTHVGLAAVEKRIEEAAKKAQRAREEVTLIAVSKTFAGDEIKPVLMSGQKDFGENRVQEAKIKWPDLKAAFPQTRLHLIGSLQSNKAGEAVSLFDAIHTLDRPKLAKILAQELARRERRIELFIQINTGEERQKSGVGPKDADSFIAFCREDLRLPIKGLMCLPPVDEEPALHFALLAQIAKRNGLRGLSMGMSGDVEKAIALGATHVRIGTAIFGDRPAH